MSAENVYSFLEKASQNEEMRKNLASQRSYSDIVALASEHGYEFSVEEFEKSSVEYMETHNKLTEEQLETVSGGVFCSSSVIIINTESN